MIDTRRHRIVQTCFVVRELEGAAERMNALYGIGPFIGGIPFELGDHVYRGDPAPPIRLRGMFVQAGDTNIELVQVLSDGPSAFHDAYPAGAEGLHHVAIFCEDYEAERARFQSQGCAVASEFTTNFGARICYVDPGPMPGHMIELYPEHPRIRAMYARTREASEQWDGKRLFAPWSDFDLESA